MASEKDRLIREFQRDRLRLIAYIRSLVGDADLTEDLFQVHIDGSIWRYTGTPCSGNNCPGWQLLDNNLGMASSSGTS